MLVRARHQTGGGRGAGMGWRMVVEGEGEARVRYFGDQWGARISVQEGGVWCCSSRTRSKSNDVE